MEGFSLSMPKGGTLQKKTPLQTLVVYPPKPERFGAFPTWILGWKWQILANLRSGSNVGCFFVWIFPDFFFCPKLVQITSKLPGKKNTPSARCISYKKWWFSNLSFASFPGVGGNRVTQYLLLVQVKEFNKSSSTRKSPPFLLCVELSAMKGALWSYPWWCRW